MSMEEFRNNNAFPYYLTEHERTELAVALRTFSDKSNLYTFQFPGDVLQGDCFDKIPFYDYARQKLDFVRVVVLSNSCDIDPSNKRDVPVAITYAPVIRLADYRDALLKAGVASGAVSSKVSEIKRQSITSMLFLPASQSIADECVALLDRVFSIPYSAFVEHSQKTKQFSLNQLGHYLFCFKLSVHYCRLHEAISRG